ncbi:MAG: glycosyltransferase [Planctomycetota bacterium]|nr:glycosyltransferase [Planctomycetota bacterium]
MSNDGFFTADPQQTAEAVAALGKADLVIGIPSLNEADNVAFVVDQVDQGAREHYPDLRTVIVNVDNNSPDGTREAFEGAPGECGRIYISTPEGIAGKGNNFYNLFRAAQALDARAVMAVDADLESIRPDWVQRIAGPVLEHDCDYVTPMYARNEYDGTITNHICYPLIHGLLGTDLRQPIGGDFGLSRAFVDHVMTQDWLPTTREYGIDIFLTMNALLGGDFTVGQTYLGAKVHKPSAPKLGPMFIQVITTLFTYLTEHWEAWSQRRVLEEPRAFGAGQGVDPQDLAVDFKAIRRKSLEAYAERRETIQRAMSAKTFDVVDAMMRAGRVWIDTLCWTYVVYDMLYAFHEADVKEEVVEALSPLFFARSACFIRNTIDFSHQESEESIRRQAREFRRSRRYLVDRLAARSSEAAAP